LKSFLKRKISPIISDKIEYSVMEKFPINRVLFTAEHAMAKEIPMKKFGSKAYIGIGDRNTDILAKLAAYYLRSAYMFPLFLRTDADAARPPQELGKGSRLFVKIFYSEKQATSYIPNHLNQSYLPYLKKYHQLIEKLNPNILVSIHGMHMKRKFDALFGFGEDYQAIGGKKEAFRFKNEFTSYLDKVFRGMDLKNNLNLGVSTWLLTGSKNYVLTKHVIGYNRKNKNKRMGMQVEFNRRGRVGIERMPILPYQVFVQALGDFISKWIDKL